MPNAITDRELQRAVLDALAKEATLVPGEIAVSVRDGIVTISGYVRTYAEKCEALDVALRASGVNAVADEVQVRVPASFHPSDSDMAGTLVETIVDTFHLPPGAVHIAVQRGWVTLRGVVPRREQREAIERAARTLVGFTGLSNLIETERQSADTAQPTAPPDAPNDVTPVRASTLRRST